MGESKRRIQAGTPSRMHLTCYETTAEAIRIRPAPPDRDWMDASNSAFAYRCLPLVIANAHGWEILSPVAFEAEWTGSNRTDGVKVTPLSDFGDYPPVMSHFGEGVLTFHVAGLFRTDPGINLWVNGPINRPKHGIAPLTGVVETDWSVASFTMNWKFTAPGVRVRFDVDEPFCAIFPLPRAGLEEIQPEVKPLGSDLETYNAFIAWREQRVKFIGDLQTPGTDANQAGWERSYFQGKQSDGKPGSADHRTRIRVKPFRRSDR
jgi:hypothetical protein